MEYETKDIKEIELTYNCWMSFRIDELVNAELFKTGKVVRFWVKYCTLHMELQDGTIVEEDVFDVLNEDLKWPTQVMVEVGDDWEEYHV